MNEQLLKIYLGQRIRYYRKKYNMTQDVLGEKIDRNQRQISLIENGTSFPTPETLIKISEVFNCSLQDLFNFELVKNRDNIQQELQDIIKNLSEEKLRILYLISKNL